MNARCSVLATLLIMFGSSAAMAQNLSSPSADDVRTAMYRALAAIEEAAGIEPNASRQIAEMSDAAATMLFNSMENADEFIATAQRIADRVAAARMTRATSAVPYNPTTSAAVAGYPPSYPSYNVHYEFLKTLGLVDSPDDRCGDELAEYEAFVATLQQFSFLYQTICTVVSCDPTGIVCAVACTLVGIVNVAIDTAALPMRACSAHGGNVNSAEIEAAYENTVLLLGAGGFSGGGTAAAGDGDIVRRLEALEAAIDGIRTRQDEIVRLLKSRQEPKAASR